jgi:hypothetical protein
VAHDHGVVPYSYGGATLLTCPPPPGNPSFMSSSLDPASYLPPESWSMQGGVVFVVDDFLPTADEFLSVAIDAVKACSLLTVLSTRGLLFLFL